jgi:fumarate hydratase class I
VRDVSHLFRPGHLAQLRAIVDDPEASDNDRFVAMAMLRNACVSASMVLPSCQDTGTAIVIGKKGQRVWTGAATRRRSPAGIYDTYTQSNLRYSQLAPDLGLRRGEHRSNLPAQIELYATDGDEYRFLFVTKGGGSANKTFLFQETKALLNRESLMQFPRPRAQKARHRGLSAVPSGDRDRRHLRRSDPQDRQAGELSAILDDLPATGNALGHCHPRSRAGGAVLGLTRQLGIGAQFGGKYFCHDVRVIRLPRTARAVPVGIGVSCSADRQAKARITGGGRLPRASRDQPGSSICPRSIPGS